MNFRVQPATDGDFHNLADMGGCNKEIVTWCTDTPDS